MGQFFCKLHKFLELLSKYLVNKTSGKYYEYDT
jgi:hypothetical protein